MDVLSFVHIKKLTPAPALLFHAVVALAMVLSGDIEGLIDFFRYAFIFFPLYIYFNNDKDWGTNPCCEIGLRPFQFCNLCEVNVSNLTSQEDLNERVEAAAFIGTLQASYTDFHYLRPIWRRTTEKDSLLGIGLTGIGSGKANEVIVSITKANANAKTLNLNIDYKDFTNHTFFGSEKQKLFLHFMILVFVI